MLNASWYEVLILENKNKDENELGKAA